MAEDEEEPRVRVTDKRKLKRDPAPDAPEKAGEKAGEKVLGDNAGVHVGSVEAPAHPPIDFGNFALSLAHGALVAMGLVEHPELGGMHRDLDTARQSIEILEMLAQKTKGNLDTEEEKLLGSLLYELRMSFVTASAQKVEPGS